MQIESEEVSSCTLTLDYFEHEPASRLIDLYARKELTRLLDTNILEEGEYNRRLRQLEHVPTRNLKEAYFSAIESALHLGKGDLWVKEIGKTFAGYAPVLASIGTLLASISNPIVVTNKLQDIGTSEAWDVIDTVIREILDREQLKLREKLRELHVVPDNAYDQTEQLSYLAQIVGGLDSISLTGNVVFERDADERTYLEKVRQQCVEHPFVRSGEMANDVLGAKILAYVMCNALEYERIDHVTPLRRLSKTPFLWRSVRREMLDQQDPFLEGSRVGYVTASYWNDPSEGLGGCSEVRLTEMADGLIEARIGLGGGGNREISLSVMPPVMIYGTMKDCHIDCPNGGFVIEGVRAARGPSSSSYFAFEGNNRIVCGSLDYRVEIANVAGSIWLDAQTVVVPVRDPQIHTIDGAQFGWGEVVAQRDPWRHKSGGGLGAPPVQTPLSRLVTDCCERIPANGIVLLEDYSPSEGENQMAWARRHGAAFRSFVELLVGMNLADRSTLPAKKTERKFRIKVSGVPWEDLKRACMGDEEVDQATQELALESARVTGLDGHGA